MLVMEDEEGLMGNVLVMHAGTSGATESVADQIGETLRDLGHTATVVPAAEAPQPDGYDAVFVGSGIRATRWHRPARTWLTTHATTLASTPVAAFAVCASASEPASDDAAAARQASLDLLSSIGISPVTFELVPGWYLPEKFRLWERVVMRIMRAPQGDWRDLPAVARWTRETAPRLGL